MADHGAVHRREIELDAPPSVSASIFEKEEVLHTTENAEEAVAPHGQAAGRTSIANINILSVVPSLPHPGCVIQQERELLVQHLTKAEGHLAGGGRLSITYSPMGLVKSPLTPRLSRVPQLAIIRIL